MLQWRNLQEAYPASPETRAIVECCRRGGSSERPREEVIFAKIPRALQKPPHNQPPFRYRCTDCGPPR